MAENFDYMFKFIIIGNSATGKSCLLHRFIDNKFKKDSTHTIGVEFGSKIIHVKDKLAKLQIWDTAGQERFRSVTRSYYRNAAGAILVYDISNRESYNSVSSWLADAKSLANPDIVIILIGNKTDLDNSQRQVPFNEASKYAQENGLLFFETSAQNGSNVDEVFMKCAYSILSKIEDKKLDPESMGSGVQIGGSRSSSSSSRPAGKEGSESDGGCPC